jgi:hypothetical protein
MIEELKVRQSIAPPHHAKIVLAAEEKARVKDFVSVVWRALEEREPFGIGGFGSARRSLHGKPSLPNLTQNTEKDKLFLVRYES